MALCLLAPCKARACASYVLKEALTDRVLYSVVLDRACVLEEAGLNVAVGRLFPQAGSRPQPKLPL